MLYTIGHGRLAADDLMTLLQAQCIAVVVDVRRHPASRRSPHFGRAALGTWLADGGIGYSWAPELGGRRDLVVESPHTAIADPRLRAYADHMQTPEFEDGLTGVVEAATRRRAAVMCAEGDWRPCHRRYLADAAVLLFAAEVLHLRHDGGVEPHGLTATVRHVDGTVVYDGGQPRLR